VSTHDDDDPFVTSDGLTLWFTSDRGANVGQFTATRATRDDDFGEPQPVKELSHDERAVSLTDDQLDIFYEISTTQTRGLFTQHRAHATDSFAMVGQPITITGNTANKDSPAISGDGQVLLFGDENAGHPMRATGRQGNTFSTFEPFGNQGDSDASTIDDDAIVFSRNANANLDLFMAERSCK
jgi:hypothetical protein